MDRQSGSFIPDHCFGARGINSNARRYARVTHHADVIATLRETIARVNALPQTPQLMLHTGDLTHLSDPPQFDTLAQLLKECKTTDVFYVPGEHDIYDNGVLFKERFGKNTNGTGWYSFELGKRRKSSRTRTKDEDENEFLTH